MSILRKSITARVATVVLGLAIVMSFTFAPSAYAQTVDDLQAQINSLLAQIADLQALLSGSGQTAGAGVCPYTWTRSLTTGSRGDDVMALQKFLNSDSATQLGSSGAGSPGNETSYFGSITSSGVVKFQEKYRSEVLDPLGLPAGTGFFGSSSRAKANALCVSAPTPDPDPDPDPDPVPTGTSLSVSAGTQPANSLAPKGAARVPFTNFSLTAGADGAVVLNSVTVERTGLANDSNFSGVVLLDGTGTQIGLERTLNSNHQATVGEDVTVPAGQTMNFTIGGNIKSAAADVNNGEVASFDVIAINTSAAVSGSLPIRGATHTLNDTLSIGTVTTTALSHSNATKDIGTTGYRGGSFRLQAGSAEKVRLNSIRWNQTGSAGTGDIENIMVYIDGVAYPTTVSADGNYYTTVFPDGILFEKGANKEVDVRYDIVDGSGRTVVFDIFKKTDVNIVGEQFGYGITPPAGAGTAATTNNVFTAGTPWLDGAEVTISGGSLTVTKANSVNAQNIAENAPDQPFGGFEVEVKGETITVGSLVFNFQVTGTGDTGDLTNVSLVDSNGSVVAGPVDVSSDSATFSTSITFPVGMGIYTLRGKVGTDAANNDTIIASTTPSSDWTTITGDVSGNSITASPSTAVTANTMTVKVPQVTISVDASPIAQTIVEGAAFGFANYTFDAQNSGDDVFFSSIPLAFDASSGTPTSLTNCTLWDGSTALTTGSNRVDPSASGSSTTFTFDSRLTIPRQTVKTVGLTCEVSATTSGATMAWGVDSGQTFSANGVDSGGSATVTVNDSTGQYMTINTGGSYTVVDDSTPGYRLVTPGTEVELLRLKFSPLNEDVDIQKVALELASAASNTPVDLVGQSVTLYDEDGSTVVGTAQFTPGDNATSTLSGQFRAPSGDSRTIIVKGTIAGISASGPLTASGDLLIVGYDGNNNGSNGNHGTGVSSGTTITPSSSDIAPSGVRIMESFPTVAKIDLSSSDRLLQNGSRRPLYKFSVSADSNSDLYIYKFSFSVSSSSLGATTSVYGLYTFTDSGFSTVDGQVNTDGLFNFSNAVNGSTSDITLAAQGALAPTTVELIPLNSSSATTTFKVPKGQTRWFLLDATLAQVETGSTNTDTITVQLLGDAAFPSPIATLMVNVAGVHADGNNDFIWSPNSTSTSNTADDLDWTNGFQVPGLPSAGTPSEALTSAG